MRKNRNPNTVFTIILIIYCLYAAAYIARTSCVVDGQRYFTLFDDAMISMKYARNLVEGQGFVWNPGEKVQGYTNPLWTLYMALLHLLPVAESKLSLLVQVSSMLALVATLFVLRKAAHVISPASSFTLIASVLLTAFYLPLNCWALQGMEVGILALLVTLAILSAVRCIRAERFSALPYLILGVAMLMRMDMAVTLIGVLVFLSWALPQYRKRSIATGLTVLAVFLIPQLLLQKWYYGDALPNTYYLKLTGYPFFLRLSRGFYVTSRFIWSANVVFFVLPVIVIVTRRDTIMMLLGWVFLVQVLYSVYVGGDAWESYGGSNRYIAVAMPVYFLLLAKSIADAGSYLRERIDAGPEKSPVWAHVKRHPVRITAVVLICTLLSFNSIQGPIALWEWLLITGPLHRDQNAKMVERGLLLREITTPAARLAVTWDGAIPYFSHRRCISILGKNDPRIARISVSPSSMPDALIAFFPGHMKWDYDLSIGQLRPDIVVQLWLNQEKATPYLERSYVRLNVGGFTLDFLRDSPNVRWDLVERML